MISNLDQKVDKEKYDENFDNIDWGTSVVENPDYVEWQKSRNEKFTKLVKDLDK